MCKRTKKEDFRPIATEINITINDKITIANLNYSIKNSDIYINKPAFVAEIAITIIEKHKHVEKRQTDLWKIQIYLEKIKLERLKMN